MPTVPKTPDSVNEVLISDFVVTYSGDLLLGDDPLAVKLRSILAAPAADGRESAGEDGASCKTYSGITLRRNTASSCG